MGQLMFPNAIPLPVQRVHLCHEPPVSDPVCPDYQHNKASSVPHCKSSLLRRHFCLGADLIHIFFLHQIFNFSFISEVNGIAGKLCFPPLILKSSIRVKCSDSSADFQTLCVTEKMTAILTHK